MRRKQWVFISILWVGLAAWMTGCMDTQSLIPTLAPTPTVPIPAPISNTPSQTPLASSAPVPTPTATPTQISLPGTYDRINPADQARLVYIPGGDFEMGSFPEQAMAVCETLGMACEPADFADELPVHHVTLDGYYLYQFEVTNAQYRMCVEAGECPSPAFGEFYNDTRFAQHPVVFVNWFAAETYCTWAGGRLPWEAEWEYAARGVDGRTFPWGEEAECGFGNYSGCTQGLTMEIGSFPDGASPFGVFDLSGNVTEWVGDWYGNYPDSDVENPTGPLDGELRVARGGSWKNPILGVRTTDRTANFPEVYSSGTGFRCVIPAENGN